MKTGGRPIGGNKLMFGKPVTLWSRVATPVDALNEYVLPLCKVTNAAGKVLRWEDATGKRVPEAQWPHSKPPREGKGARKTV